MVDTAGQRHGSGGWEIEFWQISERIDLNSETGQKAACKGFSRGGKLRWNEQPVWNKNLWYRVCRFSGWRLGRMEGGVR